MKKYYVIISLISFFLISSCSKSENDLQENPNPGVNQGSDNSNPSNPNSNDPDVPEVNLGINSITITGNITNAEALAQLEKELGSTTTGIEITNTTQLTELSISGLIDLKSITININNNKDLTKVILPDLENTTGSISVSGNNEFTTLEAPNLNSVGLLVFIDNPKLLEISYSVKSFIIGLTARNNASLTRINLPNLESDFIGADENISISNNTLLISINIPNLRQAESIGISGNPSLISFNLERLELISSSYSVFDNKSLISINFPSLTKIPNNSDLVYFETDVGLPNKYGTIFLSHVSVIFRC